MPACPEKLVEKSFCFLLDICRCVAAGIESERKMWTIHVKIEETVHKYACFLKVNQ